MLSLIKRDGKIHLHLMSKHSSNHLRKQDLKACQTKAGKSWIFHRSVTVLM